MALRVTTAGDGQKSALIFPMMMVVLNGLSFSKTNFSIFYYSGYNYVFGVIFTGD